MSHIYVSVLLFLLLLMLFINMFQNIGYVCLGVDVSGKQFYLIVRLLVYVAAFFIVSFTCVDLFLECD